MEKIKNYLKSNDKLLLEFCIDLSQFDDKFQFADVFEIEEESLSMMYSYMELLELAINSNIPRMEKYGRYKDNTLELISYSQLLEECHNVDLDRIITKILKNEIDINNFKYLLTIT